MGTFEIKLTVEFDYQKFGMRMEYDIENPPTNEELGDIINKTVAFYAKPVTPMLGTEGI